MLNMTAESVGAAMGIVFVTLVATSLFLCLLLAIKWLVKKLVSR